MSQELDGIYQITSTSNYEGPLERKSDGRTEIRDGRTERRDGNNVVWKSEFRIISETEVDMVSLADPAEASPEFALIKPDGTPTYDPVTYTSRLKLARKGDQIQMSGRVEYGDEVVLLTLRKIGD